MSYFKKSKRSSLVFIYDVESSTYLSIFNNPNSFNIPGGKCFENESFEDCAIRELSEETNLNVDKKDLNLIINEKCGDFQVATFLSKNYSGRLEAEDGCKVEFVPLEYLLLNENQSWIPYHKKILEYVKSKK